MKTRKVILFFLWAIVVVWAVNIVVLLLGYDICFFTMQSLKWFELPGRLWMAYASAVSGLLAAVIALLMSTLSDDVLEKSEQAKKDITAASA